MKGQPREKVDAAVRRAVGDAVFRYVLFLRLNTSALEMSEREGLRAAETFYWMGCLLSGPREADLQPEEWIAHQAEQAEAWQSWRWVLASILVVSLVEEEAREHLQAHYLGGQLALLTGVQADWDRFAEQVDGLWSIAQSTGLGASAQGDKPPPTEGEQEWDQRVHERALVLADDARISTFERLGENLSAVAILERRLGTQSP
jgi:hypothetical protein